MLKRGDILKRRFRQSGYFFLGLAVCGLSIVIATQAAELDSFGPPPDNDVSHQRGPFIGLLFADNALVPCIDNTGVSPPGCTVGLGPANEGAIILQGDVQGTHVNVGVNNVVPEPGIERAGGEYNIPTNSLPSPLFGAQSFTQQMLLFEEFGPEALSDNTPLAANPFPQPTDNQTGPAGTALEGLLAQERIGPFPPPGSNTLD